MKLSPIDDFIESWGAMGMLWGINRSMARIHALILISEDPLRLDQIAERLAISRGNVSMSLRELRSWGVIQRANIPGDRRDYFAPEPDTWTMFFRIASERKRREFDPALSALRSALTSDEGVKSEEARARLSKMEELLGTIDRMASGMLANKDNAQTLFHFFSSLAAKKLDRS